MAKTTVTWIGDDKFVVMMDRAMTREAVIARGKAFQGTFSSEIISRLWDCFCGGLTDLKKEYEDYYKPEYPSFGHFLFWKCGLPKRVVRTILASDSDDRLVALGDACASGDYILSQMVESEVGHGLLAALLDLDEGRQSDGEDDDHESES